jgi:peptidoglycan/LPS O-acetylase OafA/YrhL
VLLQLFIAKFVTIEPTKIHHFPHINLLRAFAALSVVVYHVIELGPWLSFPHEWPFKWFRIGWMAVDLFFVISGFVIAWSLIQLRSQNLPSGDLAKQFMLRRFARIAPLYYVTCIAYVVLVSPEMVYASDFWWQVISHLLFIHSWGNNTFGSINGFNWAIAVEMQFYVFVLLLLGWWSKQSPVRIMLTGILTAWICRAIVVLVGYLKGWAGPWPIFMKAVQMPMMLDEFACGIALAMMVWRYPPSKWPGTRFQQGLVLTAALALTGYVTFATYFAYSSYWGYPLMVIFWRTGLGIFFALVLVIAIWLPALSKPGFLYRSFYYLGDISYGIYLWHFICLSLLKQYFSAEPVQLLTTVMILTLMLAAASWHLLEKPLIKWGKRHTEARIAF